MPAYIVQAGQSGLVKIGHAERIADRLRSLQTAHAERLELLRVVEGEGDVEGALHDRFKACRIRGEWFSFHPEMMTFIPPRVLGRKYARHPRAAENAAFAAALDGIATPYISRCVGVSQKTVENWKAGRSSPDWPSVVAMLNDKTLASRILSASGRGDLATLEKQANWGGA